MTTKPILALFTMITCLCCHFALYAAPSPQVFSTVSDPGELKNGISDAHDSIGAATPTTLLRSAQLMAGPG